ncbi:MAG: tetratricopeptide repeat protein [Parvularculaceae bacterium]|nr:tetratricopeptide repeat protein [Parvularculaceae bacterium]
MTARAKGFILKAATGLKGDVFVKFLAIAALAFSAALAASPAYAAGSGSAGGLPSSSRPKVDPAKAFSEGVDALRTEDYKKAEKKFRDVLSVAPKHPEANYYMALARIGNGKPKSAVRYLETAIEERGDFVEARERLALVQIELGKPEAARDQLLEIEAKKSECAQAGNCDEAYVARVETALSRIAAALEAPSSETSEEDAGAAGEEVSDQAYLLFAPRGDGVALYTAAVRLINEHRYLEAIDQLYDAQAIIGPHPDILNYLGYAHRKIARIEKAKEYYHTALAIDPDHKGANEYLGELYLQTGEMGEAKKQLARLDRICVFGCVEREDLARLISRREGAIASN